MSRRTSIKLIAWLALGALAVVAGVGCLTVSVADDRPELSRFVPPEKRGLELVVHPLRTGAGSAPRCAGAGDRSCLCSVPVVHVAYLVRHPRGTFLIDAALAANARERDLGRFSFTKRWALSFDQESGLKEELRKLGSPRIDFVLVTHAHWDHTSGLTELDRPRVILGPGEAEFVRGFDPEAVPSVMPEHLANADLDTFAWDGPPYENFPQSHDWFGDGSVVLVPLPGHTPGSYGVFVNSVNGQRLLFVGDAVWSLDALEKPSHKLKPASDVADHDRAVLSDAIWRLKHLQDRDAGVLIVPAHAEPAYDAVVSLLDAGR